MMLASEAQDAALALARFGVFNPAPYTPDALAESPAAAYREAWLEAEVAPVQTAGAMRRHRSPACARRCRSAALADLQELNRWLKDVWTDLPVVPRKRSADRGRTRSHLDALEDTLAKLERLNVDLAHLLRADSLLAVNIGSLPACRNSSG